ncbi:MAG: tetratricopeptide repeat protein [Planctomycetota bacterium]|jgi:tetratricopeptide (TPR) repeat protein
MSKLLEIFGKAITVDTADLIWHWLNAVKSPPQSDGQLCDFDDLDEIVELLGNMEVDKAREKLKFYLFENPECARGRMAAAAICLRKNEINEAIEQAQSVYLRQPSNTMALYTLGYCRERLGQEAEAIQFYQDCIKFKGHLQLPRQRMAAVYFKNSRIDKAIMEYELLTTEHPEDISSQVILGYLYIEDSQYDKATETFNMGIVAHPDNFHNDGESEEIAGLIETGQFDDAIERTQWLMEQIGPMADLHVRLADIYSHAGRPAEAIAHYENALRCQPNYLEATIKLGTHYLRCGRVSLAAEQFNRAVEINDEIVDTYIGLAISQYHANQNEESYRTLSLASAIQQNSTLLFSETATLHLQATMKSLSNESDSGETPKVQIEDVIKAHKAQMANTPTSADIHYKYGILMMIDGNAGAAIESFENALDINPTHHRSRSKLAICLYETGHDKLAIKKLTEPDVLKPGMLRLHYQTAILYCDRCRFARALCNLENTMKNNFTQPDALVNIEVVLENLGLVDRAISTWERLKETAHNAISARYI